MWWCHFGGVDLVAFFGAFAPAVVVVEVGDFSGSCGGVVIGKFGNW